MQVTYEFVVLRYVHDILTEEFVNIGIVIFSKDVKQIKFLHIEPNNKGEYIRVSGMFPTVNKFYIRLLLNTIETTALKIQENFNDNTLNHNGEMETKILTRDDSSLQWSKKSYGLTDDLDKEAQKLFDRFVMKFVK